MKKLPPVEVRAEETKETQPLKAETQPSVSIPAGSDDEDKELSVATLIQNMANAWLPAFVTAENSSRSSKKC